MTNELPPRDEARLRPQKSLGERLRDGLRKASTLLAWAQVLSLVATSVGVVIALAASWVAWRVHFHGGRTDVAAAFFELCRRLLGVEGHDNAAYALARRRAFSGASVAYGSALLFVALAGLRGITSRWFRRLGWALAVVAIVLGVAGFLAGFVLASDRAPTTEAEWINGFCAYLAWGAGFVSLLGGVWSLVMWVVSVVTGAVEWGVERHRREVPSKGLSGVRVSAGDTPPPEPAEALATNAQKTPGNTTAR